MYIKEINQTTAAERINEGLIALLPTGAVEVHGDHLPLGTDIYLADGVAAKVAEKLGYDNCLVMPCVPYGQVWSLRDTKGTIDVPNEVLVPYLVNIAMSLYRSGIRKLAFINGHVGNVPAIKSAMRDIFAECDMKVYSFTYPGADEAAEEICTSERPHKAYFHADEIETSYMLYLRPDKVDMSKAVVQYPTFGKDFDYTPSPWTDIMDTAVLGDPTVATEGKGKAIIDIVVDNIIDLMT